MTHAQPVRLLTAPLLKPLPVGQFGCRSDTLPAGWRGRPQEHITFTLMKCNHYVSHYAITRPCLTIHNEIHTLTVVYICTSHSTQHYTAYMLYYTYHNAIHATYLSAHHIVTLLHHTNLQ